MAIRTTEKDVPHEFPPARLFLDDIQEIVSILEELETKGKARPDTKAAAPSALLSAGGGQECDDVQELPKIAKWNSDITIVIGNDYWPNTSLHIHPLYGSSWRGIGFTKEASWNAYHRLEAVFRRRNAKWPSLAHSLPWWIKGIGGIAIVFSFALLADYLRKAGVEYSLRIGVLSAILIILAVLVFSGARHTSVVLRNSWEPSPIWTYFKDKIIPVTVGAGIGVAGTLLVQHLNKLWH